MSNRPFCRASRALMSSLLTSLPYSVRRASLPERSYQAAARRGAICETCSAQKRRAASIKAAQVALPATDTTGTSGQKEDSADRYLRRLRAEHRGCS